MLGHVLLYITLWNCALGLPTTPSTLEVTTIASSNSTLEPTTDVSITNSTVAPSLNTTHTELLRQEVSDFSPRRRGRVVLATTHVEGSDEWGVKAEDAEVSCHRIAQIQTGSQNVLQKNQEQDKEGNKPNAMEGHLISVGSSYEVLALSRLLHPLPDGAFWTGGKVVRYRRHSAHDNSFTDHVFLQWSDGRSGDPRVLGMTKDDEVQLKDGYIYCLALNLLENTWQARDCSDKLPYACLITPRRLRFSNEVKSKNGSTNSTESTSKSKGDESNSKETKLMQNLVEATSDETSVSTEPSMINTSTEATGVEEGMTTESTTVPTPETLSEEIPATPIPQTTTIAQEQTTMGLSPEPEVTTTTGPTIGTTQQVISESTTNSIGTPESTTTMETTVATPVTTERAEESRDDVKDEEQEHEEDEEQE